MHSIQKRILSKLITNTELPFAKLKPSNIESNHFMYYLNKLITNELVEKNKGKYALTQKGLFEADRLSLKNCEVRIQPKIVTLISCINQKGQQLLYLRKKQPFINKMGFVYGKIHLEETIQQAAEREFLEKTGLKTKLTHKGDVYVKTYEKKKLISHMLFHIFSGSNPEGKLKRNTSIGRCFWSDPKKKMNYGYIPGFQEIYKMLQKEKNHFFQELTINY